MTTATRRRRSAPKELSPEDRAIGFMESLKQTKGRWAGKPLKLLKWQIEPLRTMFGTVDEYGFRTIRVVFWFVPRKSGKSTVAAALAAYLLFGDREAGAEIYGAASDKDQAALVYDQCLKMVEATGDLLPTWKSWGRQKKLWVPSTDSKYEAIPADEAGSHGFNAHGVIFDEYHTQRSPDLYRVLLTSTGTRDQPLVFIITTAGTDTMSPCFKEYDYACKVRDGIIDDPTYLPVIYEASPEDDWQDPKTWFKANPSLGHTVKLEVYERECRRAMNEPDYLPTFQRLFLNLWVSSIAKAVTSEQWNACQEDFDVKDLVGQECYGGLDLANTEDIASMALAFPCRDGKVRLLVRSYIPRDTALRRQSTDGVPYHTWGEGGFLKLTPGNRIDYAWIEKDVKWAAEKFDLREMAHDRWGSTQMSQRLGMEEGGEGVVKFVPVGQGYQSMSYPTKEFLAMTRAKQISHNGDPVLRWAVDNLVTIEDPAGNKKPAKNKSREKIDPVVATIMAVDRLLRHDPDDDDDDGESVYEKRGVRSFG